MPPEPGRAALPLTAAIPAEPSPPRGRALRRDDLGAFGARDPGADELVVLRPATGGLLVERRERHEIVPWHAIEAAVVTTIEAERARIPSVRIDLASGPILHYVDALAPGAASLPPTWQERPLLRVERPRLLTAAIVASAGLARDGPAAFRRGARGVPVPELADPSRRLPAWVPPVSLALSVLALIALFGNWFGALAVASVFVVHEMGHAVVMALLGIRVRGILFLLPLGAATLPEHAFASRWDDARVALAGPATGLVMAGALALWLGSGPADPEVRDALGTGLLFALGLNLLNLLPIVPLDGGRLLVCLTAGLPPRVRAIATFAPLVVIPVLLLVLAGRSLAVPLVLFAVAAFSLTRATLRRQALHQWMHELPGSLDTLRAAVRDVTHAFSGRARDDVDGGVPPTPLTRRQAGIVVALYAVEWAALFVASVAFLRAFPGVVDWFRSHA